MPCGAPLAKTDWLDLRSDAYALRCDDGRTRRLEIGLWKGWRTRHLAEWRGRALGQRVAFDPTDGGRIGGGVEMRRFACRVTQEAAVVGVSGRSTDRHGRLIGLRAEVEQRRYDRRAENGEASA